MMSSNSSCCKMSLSIDISDKLVMRSCDMNVLESFFVLFNFEKYCSPLQLVTIRHRTILVAISTLTLLTRLCKAGILSADEFLKVSR
ncbi:unnamed protein product [Acanthoscelides obtectus]|uniref:Uncharacterized protein n=1 Tax=Acanthoscelides obtectus TaxID=200917 RepID=A0A9P0QCQ7_ACAOB|nr:unnamed protein product [Acanthoscelides obtectus]CAK1688005.1 hypothetical protein AOBTE_LOCUS36511 [Acanthoscelides obtectus]